MAASHHRRLPLELFGLVARHLLPPEPFITSIGDFVGYDYRIRVNTLRNLAYTCRDVYNEVEPLLHRFVVLRNGRQIVSLFMLLAERPHLRPNVRHLICNTAAAWESILEGVGELWHARYGSNTSMDQVLENAGVRLWPQEVQDIVRGNTDILDPKFQCDESLHFAFGGVLLMAQELETLSIHREIGRMSSMNLVRLLLGIAPDECSFFDCLRVLSITAENNEYELGDTLEHFIGCTRELDVPQILIISGIQADFLAIINTLSHFLFATMPQVEELYIRSWLTPRELRRSPIANLMGTRALEQLPKFFNRLRVLDVEFVRPPDPGHDLWGAVEELHGTLEVLRLRRQRFPIELFRGLPQWRLRLVAVEECTDVPQNPGVEALQPILAAGMDGDTFKHQALHRMELNGSRFEIEVNYWDLPVATQI